MKTVKLLFAVIVLAYGVNAMAGNLFSNTPADAPSGVTAPVAASTKEVIGVSEGVLAMHDENGNPLAIKGCVPGPKGVDYMWGSSAKQARGSVAGSMYVVSQPGIARTLVAQTDGFFHNAVYDGKYIWAEKMVRLPLPLDLVHYVVLIDPASGKFYQLTAQDLPGNAKWMQLAGVKPGMLIVERNVMIQPGGKQQAEIEVITAGATGVTVKNLLTTDPTPLKGNTNDWKSEKSYFQGWGMETLTTTAAVGVKASTKVLIYRAGIAEGMVPHPFIFDPDALTLSIRQTALEGAPTSQFLARGDTGYEWAWSAPHQAMVVCRHHVDDAPEKIILPKGAIHPVFLNGHVYLIGQKEFWVGDSLGGTFTHFNSDVYTQQGSAPFYSNVYGVICLDDPKQWMYVPQFKYAP